MRKSIFLTIIALYIANVSVIGITFRFVFKPITENIPHDTLLTWVYDLVLFSFLIQTVFIGLILILTIYLMLPISIEEPQPKIKTNSTLSQATDGVNVPVTKEPRKQKQKKPKQKEKTEESEFTKEWRKLEREAK